MTCRINRLVIGEDLVILRISGRITGEDVNMLRTLLEQERSTAAIDLKDVLIVEREAVQLLAVRESNADAGNEWPRRIDRTSPRISRGARYCFTTYVGDVQVLRAIKVEALAYLLKNALHKELLDTIRAAHAGKKYISPDATLTPAEVCVLHLIAEGIANKELSEINFLGVQKQAVAHEHCRACKKPPGASHSSTL